MPPPSTPQIVGTYAPAQVQAFYLGVRISDFMDGTMISAERNADSFELKVGGDGEVAYIAKADKSGKIKFTLKQTSPSNDFLSAMLFQDETLGAAKYLINTGTCNITDNFGTTKCRGDGCRIAKFANVEMSSGEIVGREWTILVPKLLVRVGGNPGDPTQSALQP